MSAESRRCFGRSPRVFTGVSVVLWLAATGANCSMGAGELIPLFGASLLCPDLNPVTADAGKRVAWNHASQRIER